MGGTLQYGETGFCFEGSSRFDTRGSRELDRVGNIYIYPDDESEVDELKFKRVRPTRLVDLFLIPVFVQSQCDVKCLLTFLACRFSGEQLLSAVGGETL